MKKTFPLKFILIAAVLAVLIPSFLIISFKNYQRSHTQLTKNFDVMINQTVKNIEQAYQLVDLSYGVLADSLEEEIQRAFIPFKEAYFQAEGDVSKIDLVSLKEGFGEHYDLYIIDEHGVIIYTTFKKDLGLDFKAIAPNFFSKLDDIRKTSRYEGDRIATESNTGHVRKYAYWGTPDKKYVLEIGIKSQEFQNIIQKIDIGVITKDLLAFNPQLKSIKVFEVEGGTLNTQGHEVSSRVHDIISNVFKSGNNYIATDEKRQIRTVYTKAEIEGKGPSLSSRVLELEFSTAEITRYLTEMTKSVALGAGFTLLILISLIFIIAHWIANPIRMITDDLIKIASSDLEHKITVPTRTKEIDGLKDGITKMVNNIKHHLDHISSLNDSFERFVPKDFLNHMGKNSILDVGLGDSKAIKMAVLFSDLRAFTATSEKMSPDENFKFLNRYMKSMAPAVQDNHGFIDKYIGDAMMALFAGEPQDSLRAAIAMNQALSDLNDELQKEGGEAISMGIGIHSGDLILGTVGEEHRMETTVISDTVNVASRIEGMTKIYGVNILITHDILQSLPAEHSFLSRKIDSVLAKGKTKPVDIYEVYNTDKAELRQLKSKTKPKLLRGMELYYDGKVQFALEVFQSIMSENPNDQVVTLWIKRCHENIDAVDSPRKATQLETK